MTSATLLPATDRFGSIMAALRVAVAAHFRAPGMGPALTNLILRRLKRVENEVRAIVARIVAGTLRPDRARGRPAAGEAVQRRRQARPAAPALPRGYAWLCRLVPYHAAGYGSQLLVVLEEPEFAAQIVATPRLARALRPLCRMLAIEDLAWLKPASSAKDTPGPTQEGGAARIWNEHSAPIMGDEWLRLPEPVWPRDEVPVRRDRRDDEWPEAAGPAPGAGRPA